MAARTTTATPSQTTPHTPASRKRNSARPRAQADADGPLVACRAHSPDPFSRRKRRMLRTAWRMRWRFSINAKRT